MKKILNYIILGVFVTFAFSCEEDIDAGGVNYITFEKTPYSFKVDKDATTTQDLKVYAGNKTGSDRTFSVEVSAASTLVANYSVPSTVTIPANSNVGLLSVSVTDDDDLGFENQTLILNLVKENTASFGGSLTVNVAEACPNTIVKLAIGLDVWPEETTWELYDLSDPTNPVIISSGGPYSNPDDNDSTFNYEFCLDSGDYGIVVYDSYGDGGSSYSVTAGATVLASGTLTTTFLSSTFTID